MKRMRWIVGPALLPVVALLVQARAGGAEGADLSVMPVPSLPAKAIREVQLSGTPDGDLLLGTIQDDREGASWRGAFQGRVVRVHRLAVSGWSPVGGVLNYDQPRPVADLNLTTDAQGTPVAVWNENYGDNDVIVFRAFGDGAWTDWRTRYLGISSPSAARTRSVAALGGEPVLSHGEWRRGADGVQRTSLTYRQWDEAAHTWTRTPPLNDPALFSRSPALALDARGQPVAAFLTGEVLDTRLLVKRWTGERWAALGGPLNRGKPSYLTAPRLVLGGSGQPVVAWTEDDHGLDLLRASAWSGGRWVPLGGELSRASASQPTLALDAAGHPALAWIEERGMTGELHLARWQDGTWRVSEPLNVNAARDARSPSLARAGAHLYLAWREDVGGTYRVQVRRLP